MVFKTFRPFFPTIEKTASFYAPYMIGLQEMLLQTNGEQILLFPAWPKEWNVHFKLHAPGETTVEATLKNGKVTDLKVLPESREKDIVIMIEKEK